MTEIQANNSYPYINVFIYLLFINLFIYLFYLFIFLYKNSVIIQLLDCYSKLVQNDTHSAAIENFFRFSLNF